MRFSKGAVKRGREKSAARKAKTANRFSNAVSGVKNFGKPSTLSLKGGGHVGIGAGGDINRSMGGTPKTSKISPPNRTVSAAPKAPSPPRSAGATSPSAPTINLKSSGTISAGHGGRFSGAVVASAAGLGAVIGAGATAAAARGRSRTPVEWKQNSKTGKLKVSKTTSKKKFAARKTSAIEGSNAKPKAAAPKAKAPKTSGGNLTPKVSKPVATPPAPKASSGGNLGTAATEAPRLGSRESYAKTSKGIVSPLPPAKSGGKNLKETSKVVEAPKKPATPKPKAPAKAPAATKSAVDLKKTSKTIFPKEGAHGTGGNIPTEKPKKAAAPKPSAASASLQKQLAEAKAQNIKLGGSGGNLQSAAAKVEAVNKTSGGNLPKAETKAPSATLDKDIQKTSESPKSNRPPLKKGAGAAKRAAAAEANTKPKGSGGNLGPAKPATTQARADSIDVIKKAESVSSVAQRTASSETGDIKKAAKAVVNRKPNYAIEDGFDGPPKKTAKTTKVRKQTTAKAPKATTTKVKNPASTTSRANQSATVTANSRKNMIESHIKEKGVTVETKTGGRKTISGHTVKKRMTAARKAGGVGVGAGPRSPELLARAQLAREAAAMQSAVTRTSGGNLDPKQVFEGKPPKVGGVRGLGGLARGVSSKAFAPLSVIQGARELQQAFKEQERRRKAAKKAGTGNVYFSPQRT